MEWTLYLLKCADGSIYTGITKDLERRLRNHQEGKGAKYTRGRHPFSLHFTYKGLTYRQALQLEYIIRRLPHDKKEDLARYGTDYVLGLLTEK
ncbi:MAG: GIY-YIG nuclease family protein [Bacillota bacterium]|uniref:GIY-YIG nuclease family protein n=1 Tax=Thermanaerosceptrum fracticalcis TaxID=1712410 RepID=A0A7G6E160_THEFR|nr:GIY-YIG nuclease family protein [Thermanaerosceptrum fracticalcis]QNB45814.1 GIY-YIG nuclease family protein [Thermanaerosceptrum fracticalcis]